VSHYSASFANAKLEEFMAGKIDERLAELGITLPEASVPQANYVPYTVSGNLVFISGQVAVQDGEVMKGKLGDNIDIEAGRKAARACALNLITHLKTACGGDLDRVKKCLKLGGFVQGTPDFTNAPQVVNGASDLMVDVFGDAGRHARFAVAVACLPLDTAVEVDGVFEIA
jgi:enamine deaminase RidA (YjgF/YER057c/UK114 family)